MEIRRTIAAEDSDFSQEWPYEQKQNKVQNLKILKCLVVFHSKILNKNLKFHWIPFWLFLIKMHNNSPTDLRPLI